MIFTLTSKRYGRFKISFDQINNVPDKVMTVLGNMIVVQSEVNYVLGAIVYVALSDIFEVVEDGQKIPDYNLSFENNKLKATKL